MPTYDYQCEECGHEFEYFQSMNDDRLTDCPEDECEGKVKRLIGTGAGIIFKGSGFYETDYRSDSYKKAAKADSGSSSSDSSGSDSGGSSKEGSKKSDASSPNSSGSGGSGKSAPASKPAAASGD